MARGRGILSPSRGYAFYYSIIYNLNEIWIFDNSIKIIFKTGAETPVFLSILPPDWKGIKFFKKIKSKSKRFYNCSQISISKEPKEHFGLKRKKSTGRMVVSSLRSGHLSRKSLASHLRVVRLVSLKKRAISSQMLKLQTLSKKEKNAPLCIKIWDHVFFSFTKLNYSFFLYNRKKNCLIFISFIIILNKIKFKNQQIIITDKLLPAVFFFMSVSFFFHCFLFLLIDGLLYKL